MKNLFLLLSALFIGQLVAHGQAKSPDDFVGTWLVQDKDAKVELYRTKDGKLEGKCVWHKNPNAKDSHNKDPEKRNNSVIGLKVVWGFTWDEEAKEWVDGKVYKEGKEYCGWMKLNPDGTLYLKGNICRTPLGKTNTWTRVK